MKFLLLILTILAENIVSRFLHSAERKFLGVLLAIFAVSCVRANPEECTGERGDACIGNLFRTLRSFDSDVIACSELISSVDCLKEAVGDCLGERNSAADEVFEALDKLMSTCKGIVEERTEIEECYEQNEHYIQKCVYGEKEQDPFTLQYEKDDVNDNMKCERVIMMAGCFVDRVREKCGDKAASMAEGRKQNLPYTYMLRPRCHPIHVLRLRNAFH